MINFRNGSLMLAKLVPYIMSFFGGIRDVASKEVSHNAFYTSPSSSSVWGHAGMNFYEIQRARRRAHRGKMYRRYRNQPTRGMKIHG